MMYMTTGEPVTLPDGVSMWCLERIADGLADMYCSQCGISGLHTSVAHIALLPNYGLHILLSCDFCDSMGSAHVSEIQL